MAGQSREVLARNSFDWTNQVSQLFSPQRSREFLRLQLKSVQDLRSVCLNIDWRSWRTLALPFLRFANVKERKSASLSSACLLITAFHFFYKCSFFVPIFCSFLFLAGQITKMLKITSSPKLRHFFTLRLITTVWAPLHRINFHFFMSTLPPKNLYKPKSGVHLVKVHWEFEFSFFIGSVAEKHRILCH